MMLDFPCRGLKMITGLTARRSLSRISLARYMCSTSGASPVRRAIPLRRSCRAFTRSMATTRCAWSGLTSPTARQLSGSTSNPKATPTSRQRTKGPWPTPLASTRCARLRPQIQAVSGTCGFSARFFLPPAGFPAGCTRVRQPSPSRGRRFSAPRVSLRHIPSYRRWVNLEWRQ